MNILSLLDFTSRVYDMGLVAKTLQKQIKYRKWMNLLKKNQKLVNYKTSDLCYVCANGPSLKKVNLNDLEGDLIVINDYYRIADKYRMPNFYVVNDSDFSYESNRDRMDGIMACFPEIPHLFALDVIEPIQERYNNSNTNIFVFNPYGKTFNHKMRIDFTKKVYTVWNVVTRSIQLALYLNYKEVRLIGFDYSLFASRFETHMYDKEGEKVNRVESLEEMLFKYSFTTKILYEIAEYAKNHNVKIINLTSDTLLDAFEVDENSKY